MKSEKLKSILKGVWACCSFVFVPQRRPKDTAREIRTKEKLGRKNAGYKRPKMRIK